MQTTGIRQSGKCSIWTEYRTCGSEVIFGLFLKPEFLCQVAACRPWAAPTAPERLGRGSETILPKRFSGLEPQQLTNSLDACPSREPQAVWRSGAATGLLSLGDGRERASVLPTAAGLGWERPAVSPCACAGAAGKAHCTSLLGGCSQAEDEYLQPLQKRS